MLSRKWYLSTWFIALNFSFSVLGFPLISGLILLYLQQKEQNRIQSEWEECGFGDVIRIKEVLEGLKNAENQLLIQKEQKDKQLDELQTSIVRKKEELVELDDEILYQSFGFYEPKYNLVNSKAYKEKLDALRTKQKQMAKSRSATYHYENWRLEGSLKEGRRMNIDNIQLTLLYFNKECDHAISQLKFNNIASIEKRIRKSYETLNRLNKRNRIEIRRGYLNLKLDELDLAYEYEQKLEEEREEQRRINEQMREEAKVLKEIENAKKKAEKEETHFKKELMKLLNRAKNAHEEEKILLEHQIQELETKLHDVEEIKKKILEREIHTRAGHVYIISNIGSFGEDVYKIGVSRRLEPMERIKELSSPAVPFPFDVHAMIFSDDAFQLEYNLHIAFNQKRVNKVNLHKEYFRVSLQEIEEVVKKNFSQTADFKILAEAREYRETMMLEKQQN
jgi:hypothetical protein